MMKQLWYEMPDIRRRKLADAVWLPLRASFVMEKTSHYGFSGFKEEFFGTVSLMVPVANRDKLEDMNWSEFNGDNGHYVLKGKYVPSDTYWPNEDGAVGVYPVLVQGLGPDERKEWHLHQDLVLALHLKREGDKWLATREDNLEVARLRRDAKGNPVLLEFRAEFIKDYLAARDMGLYVATYRSRAECLDDASHIAWPPEGLKVSEDGDDWEGRVDAIHEGGGHFGGGVAVMRISRKDVDAGADVPKAGFPTDADVETSQWEGTEQGRKLFSIRGELWRSEWLDAATYSPRVRGDRRESPVEFIVDADGTRIHGDALVKGGLRWLWFRPEVVNHILSRPHGTLYWATRDTGGVGWSSTDTVVFGVNELGLINVLAKDIGELPEWQQRVWAASNVGPDGKMSAELYASQVKAEPAETVAPEPYLPQAVKELNDQCETHFGFPMFRPHHKFDEIITRANRFRAVNDEGLFDLAKDLARITADSFNSAALDRVAPPKDGKTGKSIKAVERLVALRLKDDAKARQVCGPLAGIYELRHADAHLPSSELDDAFALAGVDRALPHVMQGLQLLEACVTSIYDVAKILEVTKPE